MPALVHRAYSVLNIKAARIERDYVVVEGIATTPAPDRYDDIVETKGVEYKLPLPLLDQHEQNAEVGKVIAARVGRSGMRITAHVPTSTGIAYIDAVIAKLRAGMKSGLSIGFRPLKAEPRDPEKPWAGLIYRAVELLEISLVAVPANAECTVDVVKHYANAPRPTSPSARSTSSPADARRSPAPLSGTANMTLAERIKAAQDRVNALRDQHQSLIKQVEADESVDDLDEMVETVTGELADAEKRLATLTSLEKSISERAAPIQSDDRNHAPSVGTVGALVKSAKVKSTSDFFIRSALVAFESKQTNETPAQIIARRYPNDEATANVCALLVQKAAQNPAMTNVPTWAQELVRESWGAWMDDLAIESVIPRIPLARYNLDGGALKLPYRDAPYSSLSDPNLAAAWRREGDPIRVGALSLKSITLEPYSMGVIGTYTMELFERSTPNIESVIRQGMLRDTAIFLDGQFLSTQAATPGLNPAGLQSYATGANTAASTGNTIAQVTADLRGRIQQMTSLGLGRRMVWLMNPARWYGIQLAQTATGTPAFPDAANGTLIGVPVVVSPTVPAGIVFLLDASEIAFGGGTPRFMGTEVATIHEEGAAPEPIVDGAGAASAPVRSLFQTYSGALRSVWSVSWLVLRTGAVQTITGAAW